MVRRADRVLRPRILVVDDDPTVSDVVARYLDQAGYGVQILADGSQALQVALADPPALVVLDLMLPGLGGLDVFRQLRAANEVPVIMLTALSDESDRLAGLELGADDYVSKPFSPRELVLRVQSLLRRSTPRGQASASAEMRDGDLRLDIAAHQVWRGVEPVSLTVREYDLLLFLLQHPGEAFSREELLKRVWGWEFADHSTVTVHVRRLREKIEQDPRRPVRVVTVFGVGYRYEATR